LGIGLGREVGVIGVVQASQGDSEPVPIGNVEGDSGHSQQLNPLEIAAIARGERERKEKCRDRKERGDKE
jgi:hypothetical protein